MLADFENVLDRLNVASRNGEKAMCFCPAHDDHNKPSLSLKAESGRLLLHCFAGCQSENVISEIGLKMNDLFVEEGGEFSICPNTSAHLHARPENPHTDGQNRRADPGHAQNTAARSNRIPARRSCRRTSCEDWA
jgi:hypothetical protein